MKAEATTPWFRSGGTSSSSKASTWSSAKPLWTAVPARTTSCGFSGVSELASYIVNEVQEVYRLQGVKINDKHIEVIVRQMLRKAEVIEPGDSGLVPGEQIERSRILSANEALEAEGEEPAGWQPLLLGITKASLSTDSFISAASFQETTRVLTEASVSGRIDDLRRAQGKRHRRAFDSGRYGLRPAQGGGARRWRYRRKTTSRPGLPKPRRGRQENWRRWQPPSEARRCLETKKIGSKTLPMLT